MVLMLPCRVCGSTEHERDSHGRCVDTRRCLDRRSARDAATRAEQNHRLTGPPAFADADPGTCRWCGGAIVHGRRGARRWHDGREEEPDCLLERSSTQYPAEILPEDYDDGTMPENVAELGEAVIGHRIVSAEKPDSEEGGSWRSSTPLVLTLDDGRRVKLLDTSDCCAHTTLEKFLLHPERIDHVISGVGTTEGYTKWHIHADMGDVLELEVGWSCGNPFYYSYGFHIVVEPAEARRG